VPSVLLVSSLLPLVVLLLSFVLLFYSTGKAKLNKKTKLRVKVRTPAKLRAIYIYMRVEWVGPSEMGAPVRLPRSPIIAQQMCRNKCIVVLPRKKYEAKH
jgi:uncharacterized protein (DUF58 family)